ncbi:hypothetical protein [Lonsdalea quercina]|uniref:hypothetical protein n=1 Tax=Lonsdalea quercina TaxID=71657 RepID=UPI003975D645
MINVDICAECYAENDFILSVLFMTSIKKILQRMLSRRDKQNEILRLDTKDVRVILESEPLSARHFCSAAEDMVDKSLHGIFFRIGRR